MTVATLSVEDAASALRNAAVRVAAAEAEELQAMGVADHWETSRSQVSQQLRTIRLALFHAVESASGYDDELEAYKYLAHQVLNLENDSPLARQRAAAEALSSARAELEDAQLVFIRAIHRADER